MDLGIDLKDRKDDIVNERSSGVLLHISSLPGDFGIGDFGNSAYEFIDFLWKSNQKNWQILPLGITSFGDSPYQSFSAFAGNPYFIDLNEFIDLDYIHKSDLEELNFGADLTKIDYSLLYKNKMPILKKAYKRTKGSLNSELECFLKENYSWLKDFALFMTIKDKFDNKSWLEWDREYQDYNSREVLEFEMNHKEEIYFWIFTQYFFFKQWEKLRVYANNKDIKIIGDLPIYVSIDSVDVWKEPHLFKLDKDFNPTKVSGVPPDDFTPKGQLWGNPIYDWDAMKDEDYKWWIRRVEHSFKQFDILRIDHFRGFESFWEVESGKEDAIEGKWSKGPGMEIFTKIKDELGDLNIIVEDLGFITPGVRKLVEDTGFPNMKVLQFGMDHKEENEHTPHRYTSNMVGYIGTHDNETIMGWYENMSREELEYITKYFKLNSEEEFNWGIIRGLWSSAANLTIATMQDILGLNNDSRMNKPATLGENWTWRLTDEQLSDKVANKLINLTNLYWR